MGVTQETEVLLTKCNASGTDCNKLCCEVGTGPGECTLHICERRTPSCHMKLHPKHNMQKNSSYVYSGYAIVHRTNHNSRESTPSIISLCFPQAFIKLHVTLETKVGMV
jgi:hypothetical protein